MDCFFSICHFYQRNFLLQCSTKYGASDIDQMIRCDCTAHSHWQRSGYSRSKGIRMFSAQLWLKGGNVANSAGLKTWKPLRDRLKNGERGQGRGSLEAKWLMEECRVGDGLRNQRLREEQVREEWPSERRSLGVAGRKGYWKRERSQHQGRVCGIGKEGGSG